MLFLALPSPLAGLLLGAVAAPFFYAAQHRLALLMNIAGFITFMWIGLLRTLENRKIKNSSFLQRHPMRFPGVSASRLKLLHPSELKDYFYYLKMTEESSKTNHSEYPNIFLSA